MHATNTNPKTTPLIHYLTPYTRWAVGLGILFAVNLAFQIIAPEALSRFIDTVEAGGSLSQSMLVIFLYLLIMLTQTGAAALLSYASDALGQRVTDDYRHDILAHYLSLDIQTHNTWRSGEVMTRLDEDVQGMWKYYHVTIFKLMFSGILLLCVLFVLSRRSLPLFGILFVVSVLAILAFKWIQDRGVKKYERSAAAAAEFNGVMKEMVDNAVEVRAFDAVPYAEHLLKGAMKRRFRENFPASLMYGNLWSASTLMEGAVMAAALGGGMYLWDGGRISVGTVYLIFTYAQLVISPLQDFRNHMGELQGARAGMRRVQQMMDIPSGPSGGTLQLAGGGHLLEIQDVHFGYEGGPEVLHGVTLRVEPGEKVCLAGETGCGKSTLVGLVARLYEAASGEIRFGGLDIREINNACFRERVAYLPQEPQLIHGTLRGNITLFDERYQDADILSAIRDVGLEEWFSKFPRGLDTYLEMGEHNLSAGEAQLLTIVRLALKGPSLVLLDEMTARLDSDMEKRVLEAIEALCRGRSVLAIAHRASAMGWMDRIVYIDGGAIAWEKSAKEESDV